MPIIDAQIRTISCDGGCDKTITFDQKDVQKTVEANPWMTTIRLAQTGDGRNFVFCSDVCTVNGVSAGLLNPVQQKKVIDISTAGSNAVRIAAENAAKLREATDAMKSGQPVTIS